jgi:glycosyltransferase involved in cell wall biosynthesis
MKLSKEASDQRVLLVDMMSGSNDYGRELVASLAPRCDLTVVTVDNSPVAGMPGLHCLAVFPAFGGPAGKLHKLQQSISAFGTLARAVWAHRAATVHVQFFRFQLLDMLLYLCMLPWLRCLVYTAHNALPHETRPWHLWAYRAWYRCVTHVQVLSTYARDRVAEFAGLQADRVWVVPHGNYASLLARTVEAATPTHKQTGINREGRVGLFFGLIREYKGVDLLIEASALLPDELPLTLVIAGGGERALFNQYVEQAKRLGVSARFVFRPGYLTDDELAGLLRMCDFTIFPYRHIYQSGALMLSLTFSKAVVAANLQGFREYVAHEQEALLYPTGDAQGLADALVRMTTNDELRGSLGAHAAIAANTRYDWGVIAGQLLDIYNHETQ